MTDTLATGRTMASDTYTERLWPSVGAGLFGWAAVSSLSLGFAKVYGLSAGLLAQGIISVGFAAAVLIGTPRVTVSDSGLRAGRALLPPACIGRVRVLDKSETRTALGAGANRGAFFMTRGWIADSVIVTVDDPSDPHPYWQVSSRDAQRLQSALAQVAQ